MLQRLLLRLTLSYSQESGKLLLRRSKVVQGGLRPNKLTFLDYVSRELQLAHVVVIDRALVMKVGTKISEKSARWFTFETW